MVRRYRTHPHGLTRVIKPVKINIIGEMTDMWEWDLWNLLKQGAVTDMDSFVVQRSQWSTRRRLRLSLGSRSNSRAMCRSVVRRWMPRRRPIPWECFHRFAWVSDLIVHWTRLLPHNTVPDDLASAAISSRWCVHISLLLYSTYQSNTYWLDGQLSGLMSSSVKLTNAVCIIGPLKLMS